MASTSVLDKSQTSGVQLKADGANIGALGVVSSGNIQVPVGQITAFEIGPTTSTAQYIQFAEGGRMVWNKLTGAPNGTTQYINAHGAAVSGGHYFYDGPDNADGTVGAGAAQQKFLASIQQNLEAATLVGGVNTGVLQCEGLRVVNTVFGPNATIGSGTLVAGAAAIATSACDPASQIFLTRTAGASPAVGFLRVSAKNANGFTVESVDNTGAPVAADVGTFDWWIVNPNWA